MKNFVFTQKKKIKSYKIIAIELNINHRYVCKTAKT